MKYILSTIFALSITLSALADDTIIYVESVTLDTTFSHYDDVEVIASTSITLDGGFTYSSGGDGIFSANADILSIEAPTETYPYFGYNQDSTVNPGSYVVGSIKGKIGVSGSGAATYSIPIEVPAGNKGMVPQLGISYNSQSGIGLLGRGWNLAGLSAISAAGKTLYYDGETTAISETDSACRVYWNGQRLFASGGTGLEADTFYTEVRSNNRILKKSETGYQWFEVSTPDGRTLEYGKTTDSRLDLDDDTQWKWMLNKVTDSNGNTMTYTYTKVDSINQIVLDEIEYGGSSASPVNTISFHYSTDSEYRHAYFHDTIVVNNQILDSITMESNSDLFGSYAFQYDDTMGENLLQAVYQYDWDGEWYNPTTISWKEPTTTLNPSAQQKTVKSGSSYMHYTGDFTGDGITDLVAVDFSNLKYYLYKGSPSGFPSDTTRSGNIPRSFTAQLWYDLATAYNGASCSGSADPYLGFADLSHIFSGDIDGDGITELFISLYEWGDLEEYLPDDLNSSFTSTTVLEDNHFEDELCSNYDEFALSDVILDYSVGCILSLGDLSSSSDEALYFRMGDTLQYGEQITPLPDLEGRGYNSLPINEYVYYYDVENDTMISYCSLPDNPSSWGDFNGDGKADYIINNVIKTYNENTNSFSAVDTVSGTYLGMIDLNGDGVMAYVSLSAEQFDTTEYSDLWNEYCWDCTNFSDSAQWYGFLDNYGLLTAYNLYCENDNSIDCREDFIDFEYSTSSKGYEVTAKHLSDCGPEKSLGYFEGTHTSGNPMFTRALAADVDADGRNDLLLFDEDSLKVLYHGISPNLVKGNLGYQFSKRTLSYGFGDDVQLGDFNGDGVVELLFPDSNKLISFVSSGQPGKMVSGITNGMNNESRIYYKPMTSSSVYTKGTTATYPAMDFIAPWYVVEGIASDNGVADSAYVEYDYEGAKVHMQGKGFMGFSKVTVANDILNTSRISTNNFNTTYFQAYPSTVKHKIGADSIRQQRSYTRFSSVSGKRYKVEVDSVKMEDFLAGTTTWTTFDYNSDGLVSQKTTDIDGDAEITEKIWYKKAGSHIAAKPEYISRIYKRDGSTETDSSKYAYNTTTGNLTTKYSFLGTDRRMTTTYSSYNSFGDPGQIMRYGKWGLNLSTQYISKYLSYSSDGRFVVSSSDPLEFKNTLDFDLSTGLVDGSTGPNRKETTFEYGPFGRKEKTISPDEMENASSLYWVTQHVDAPDDALFYSWSAASGIAPMLTFYDARGRELRAVSRGFSDETIYTDTEYDSKGRALKKSMPYFDSGTPLWTTYNYDVYNRVATETSADTTVTSYSYNGLENKIIVHKGSKSDTTVITYNAMGEVVQSKDNIGNIVNHDYYPSGRLKETYVSEHSSEKITLNYDAQGNRTSISDPDAGTINSLYDAFGQLVRQISAKGDTSTYEYDTVGRLIKKSDDRGDFYYSYVADTTNAAFGAVDSIYNADFSLLELKSYDTDNGRLTSESRTGVGKTFSNSYTYDWYGRPMTRTYPSGLEIEYEYSSNGDMDKIQGEGLTLWSLSDVNTFGQITSYSQGSYSTDVTYTNKGILSNVTTGSTTDIVDMDYGFDDLGNLSSWEDNLTNQKELFEYDNLNRLTGIEYYHNGTHVTAADQDMGFDDCGNITSKTGISSTIEYGDGTAGPHAVTSIESPDTSYYPPPQDISYTCFNKVENISDTLTDGTELTLEFTYGLGNQRIKTVRSQNDTIQQVKWFNGDYEEDSTASGLKKYHYISAPNGLTAIFVKQGTSSDTMYHVMTDHLGSLTTVVNATSDQVQNYSFNAWGVPRDPDDWDAEYTGSLFAGRGYTVHEHLLEFDLINMNGRVYDPILGRFLSPDPFVQASGYPNNYNRYSYVLNNPLRFTDPSGYMYNPIEHEPRGPGFGPGGELIYQKSWLGHGGDYFAGMGYDYESFARAYSNSVSFRPTEAGYKYDDPNGWMTWKTENITSDDIEFTAVPVFTSGKDIETRLVQIIYFEGDSYIASEYFSNSMNSGEVNGFSAGPNWNTSSDNTYFAGGVGAEIRGYVKTEFGKSMFDNYWFSKGNVSLSTARFSHIVSHAGKVLESYPVSLSNGQMGIAKVHSFYGDNPYAPVLGRATIYYQGDFPVGFQDEYDFNWKWIWGKGSRTFKNEIKTRAVSIAGWINGATPFDITYGIRP